MVILHRHSSCAPLWELRICVHESSAAGKAPRWWLGGPQRKKATAQFKPCNRTGEETELDEDPAARVSWTIHWVLWAGLVHRKYEVGATSYPWPNATLRRRNLACSAASNWLSDFYYGNVDYRCTDPATGQQTQRGTFSYSRPATTLAINQTWDCPEGSRFWAEGSAVLDLRCDETMYQNPNWTMGQIYSNRVITCDKLTQPVPITSLRAAA
ncbi:hypothetical protein LLEC1_05962 [Akanthomyces lecanii]|uniref:AA1-like domain-containing protein n=1 Tax=Cordyceps confragosa TaxID=2714763 RepID=A0A179I8C1_CORDF|nr:hypothetical protein LLEC1_05962 [Akanthomyces lecanii]